MRVKVAYILNSFLQCSLLRDKARRFKGCCEIEVLKAYAIQGKYSTVHVLDYVY